MATRYLEPTGAATPPGNDANTGTLASPWRTWSKFKSSSVSGDKLIVIGSASEAAPADLSLSTGGDVFIGAANNFFIENLPDTHVKISALGKGNRSGFIWERWTAGGFQVMGSGSIRLGPMDANTPLSGGYFFGIVQVTGCTGMRFDGGPNKKLIINSGGGDMGLYFTNYGPGNVGCTDIIASNFEVTGNACGVMFRGGATDTVQATGGPNVFFQDFIAHDNTGMLSAVGGGTDTGAMGIALNWCRNVTVRRGVLYNNVSPLGSSPDYGADGGAIETFGATDLMIDQCEIYDNDGGIETGRSATSPFSVRNTIQRCIFRGNSNKAGKTTATAAPILARDMEDGKIINNVFDIDFGSVSQATNVSTILAYPDVGGTYSGSINRLQIKNNIFRFRNNTSRAVIRIGPNAPTGGNAIVVDYNIYHRPSGGLNIADLVGVSGNRTWAQFQAAGYETNGLNVDPQFVLPMP